MDNIGRLVQELSQVKGCKFIATTYKAIGSGEVSDITVAIGFSLDNLYRKDVETLTAMIPTLADDSIERAAAEKILDSRNKSLASHARGEFHPDYTQADTWLNIPGLPGVRVHRENGTLSLSGLVIRKQVLVAGTYKTVKSSPLTIAKNAIEKVLPSGKFRTYKLERVGRPRLNGETLELVRDADLPNL